MYFMTKAKLSKLAGRLPEKSISAVAQLATAARIRMTPREIMRARATAINPRSFLENRARETSCAPISGKCAFHR